MESTPPAAASGSDRLANLVELCELAVSVLFLYCVLRPDALAELEDRARRLWDGLLHRVSVEQARREIQSLPETDGG